MSDRQDPSQYAFTAGPADGIAALPSGTIDGNQAQTAPDGVYATPEAMTSYPDHANPQEHMSVHPERFFTQAPTPTREFGQPFPFQVSQPVYVQDGYLAGVSLRETAGAAAVVNLRDGWDPSGKLIGTYALPASGSARDWFLPGGVAFTRGLYVEVASGAVSGVVYVARTITL